MRRLLAVVLLALAGCGAPQRAVPNPPPPPRPVSAPKSVPAPPKPAVPAPVSMGEATRRAEARLESLRRQRDAREAAPSEGEIEGRYRELLERPGTPEERKPELLLRLAELAYREEEAALRQAYEKGEAEEAPPGSRYDRSIGYYAALAQRFPDSPQALTAFYNLGYLYAEEGDREQSAWAYGEVIRRDPRSPYGEEIHMRLGEAAFDAERVEEAIPHYEAVVRGGRPEYADKALYKLGWCYYNLEDYGRAAESFSRVLARGEASPENLRRETLEISAKTLLEWGGLPRLSAYLDANPGSGAYGARLHLLLGGLYAESSRYREAVEVYFAGAARYPAAPEALAMEKGAIASLLAARDPAAAGERRTQWLALYGAGSAWDRANASALGPERDRLLEEGLRLAALHYHGDAQRGQGGLERALGLYADYQRLFGSGSEEGYELAYAHGQALKEAGRLREAAEQYRRVAADPVRRSHREEAAYRRVQLLGEVHAADPAVLDELLRAHEEYVAWNPDSGLAATVLFAEGELLFEAGRFAEARGAFGRVAERRPGPPLGPRALERTARCWFREGRYAEAEQSAREALREGLAEEEREGGLRLVAFSVFRQGERREEQGDREGANAHFARLAEEFPGDESAQIALYRVAENLRALGREAEAARAYERLARQYRGSEYARGAMALSAQLFSTLGDWRAAARSYEDLYRAAPEDADAPEALLRAARAVERGEAKEEGVRLWREFSDRFPGDPRAAEARLREAELLLALGRRPEAKERLQAAWQSAPGAEADPHRARAALALGRLSLEEFEAVALRGELAEALERKEALLEEALLRLAEAAGLPYAETFTEALYRGGEAFEHLKESLLASERPEGLSVEEREEYDFLLEERAFPLEERAVGYYRSGLAAARRGGVHTAWVDRMFARLEVLVPWAYQRTEEPAYAWTLPQPPVPAGGAKP